MNIKMDPADLNETTEKSEIKTPQGAGFMGVEGFEPSKA
jgi:hypothetical protein